VPTATFRVLFSLVVLRHDRRRVLHFNVTEHPTAHWAAQQLVEAFPEAVSARYLLRDRDGIYGDYFRQRVRGLGAGGPQRAAQSLAECVCPTPDRLNST